MPATDGIRLVLTGEHDDGRPWRRDGGSYPPGTPLRTALADPAVVDLARSAPKATWLLQVVDAEDRTRGVTVGVTSAASGLLLSAHKRDAIGDLSPDGRRLFVRVGDAGEQPPVNNVFRQIFGLGRGAAE